MKTTGDMAKYKEHIRGLSNTDLTVLLEHIDKGKVPERYEAVMAECKRRGLMDKDATDADVARWQLDEPVRQMNLPRYVRSGIILLAILVLGGPIKSGWERFTESRDRKALEAKVHEQFTQLPSYEQESAFIDQAFASSFAAEYKKLSAMTRMPTEQDGYEFLANICDTMILAATKSGKENLADQLRFFKILWATNPDDDDSFDEDIDDDQ